MLDSGQSYHRGAENEEEAYNAYKTMIDATLPRAPQATITSEYWREGKTIHVRGTVTNNSEVTLSTENLAGFTAVVKWPGPLLPSHTTHNGALNTRTTPIENLAPGETGTFEVSVAAYESNIEWDKVEVYTMVDYETTPGGIFDQLQADRAEEIQDPGLINAQPNQYMHIVSATQTTLPVMVSEIVGSAGLEWTAATDSTWLTLDKLTGTVGETLTINLIRSALLEGPQEAIVTIKPVDGDDFTSISIWVLYTTNDLQVLYLPFVHR